MYLTHTKANEMETSEFGVEKCYCRSKQGQEACAQKSQTLVAFSEVLKAILEVKVAGGMTFF